MKPRPTRSDEFARPSGCVSEAERSSIAAELIALIATT